MQVIDRSPYNGQTDVYLDVTMWLEFDVQPNADSLTDKNVILYKLDGITDEVTGAHPIIINILEELPTKIEISPVGNLSPSSRYSLFLRGDTNVNDAYPVGIKDIDNNSMDGNYIIKFSTGTEYESPDENNGEWHSSEPSTSEESSTDEEIILTTMPSGLLITSTNPYDGETLSSVSNVIINFNYPISENVDPMDITVKAESTNFPFNEVVFSGSGYFTSAAISDDHKQINYTVNSEYTTLNDNTIYNLKLLSSDIYSEIARDDDDEEAGVIRVNMTSDYSWFYTGAFDPAYADPRQIRGETGSSFDDFPNIVLWYYIHENSLYHDQMTGVHYTDMNNLPYAVNRWTICKTISDLYALKTGAISTDYRGTVQQKQLGDLMIKYGGTGQSSGLTGNKWLECINKMWKIIIGPLSTVGVKSGTTRKYPGRRRSNYNVSISRNRW